MAPPRTMHWFRWHHNTTNDHVLRRIATHSHTSVANVVAVWACVLESASESPNRGTLGSWDTADVAFVLGIDEEIVVRIYSTMQGQVLDGQQVINWHKRNPKREDERPAHSHRTPQIPTDSRDTPLEERRGDKRRREKKKKTTSSAVAAPAPSAPESEQPLAFEWPQSWAFDTCQRFLTHSVVMPTATCGTHAKLVKGTMSWEEWLRVVDRMAASDDLGYGLPALLRQLPSFRDDTQLDPNRPLTLEEALA